MIECNVNQIRKSFGADLVFENISFSVQTGERIGLIGPNGSGKTTILKILTGQEQQDEGEITFRKGTNVGYLDQIPNFGADVIVEDILREAKTNRVKNSNGRLRSTAIKFTHSNKWMGIFSRRRSTKCALA